MPRAFFVAMLVAAMMFVLNPLNGQADSARIFGDWHLISMTDDENMPSPHHVDLRFKESAGEVRGAIVSRNDGTETSLASVQFDGSTLRFKMVAPPGRTSAQMPTMVMTRAGERFEGYWTNPAGNAIGFKLKLVRAK